MSGSREGVIRKVIHLLWVPQTHGVQEVNLLWVRDNLMYHFLH